MCVSVCQESVCLPLSASICECSACKHSACLPVSPVFTKLAHLHNCMKLLTSSLSSCSNSPTNLPLSFSLENLDLSISISCFHGLPNCKIALGFFFFQHCPFWASLLLSMDVYIFPFFACHYIFTLFVPTLLENCFLTAPIKGPSLGEAFALCPGDGPSNVFFPRMMRLRVSCCCCALQPKSETSPDLGSFTWRMATETAVTRKLCFLMDFEQRK